MAHRFLFLGLIGLTFSLPTQASAYATGSSATKDCHERITVAALDEVGHPGGAIPPEDDNARALARQQPIDIPARHQDLWGTSLIIGTRWPDFEGAEPSDFVSLNHVHLDPADQREHCLRTAEQDDLPGDPAGSRAAVAECRAFILEEVALAIGATDTLDLNATETHEMWLAFVGSDDVAVQTYGFHMGQALHAIQDSFSHTIRSEDGRRIRHVFNFVETANGTHDPTVDGHEHLSELDDCELGTQLLDSRVAQATTASAELLFAVGSAGTRAERLAAAEAVLDGWLTFDEDGMCVNDIYACDPPELNQPAKSGCSAAGDAGGGWSIVALLGLALLGIRRMGRGVVAASALALVLGAGSVADAQSSLEPETSVDTDTAGEDAPVGTSDAVDIDEDAEDSDPAVDEEVAEAEAEVEAEGGVVVGRDGDEITVVRREEIEARDGGAAVNDGIGFQLSAFGSLDEAGMGVSLGLRIPLAKRFILGIDGEYDAWFSVEAGRFERGALNAYLTGIVVWKTLQKVEIRTNLHAGITVQLAELYNSGRYSVGPMFGITPLAFAVRVTRAVRVTIDPGGIFVEIPRVDPGPPLLRRAHRLMVGLQITP